MGAKGTGDASEGWQTLHRHEGAPPLPAQGAPCNGCGVCCLYEPCPVGVIATRRRDGPCRALVWLPDARQYRCGLVLHPERFAPRFVPFGAALLARLAPRWIAAEKGCDAALEVRVDA